MAETIKQLVQEIDEYIAAALGIPIERVRGLAEIPGPIIVEDVEQLTEGEQDGEDF